MTGFRTQRMGLFKKSVAYPAFFKKYTVPETHVQQRIQPKVCDMPQLVCHIPYFFLEPVQDLLHYCHLQLGTTHFPHLQPVSSG